MNSRYPIPSRKNRAGQTACGRRPRIEHSILYAGLVAASLAAGIGVQGSARAAEPDDWAKGRILVQPRAGLAAAEFEKILKPHGGKSAGRIGKLDVHVVELPPGVSEQAIAALLARHPHLKSAELDKRVKHSAATNDPYYASEWHIAKIGAPIAWDSALGAGVTIAILDTGVDGAHPDLNPRLVPGWNMYDNNSDTSDVHGHGTAVAGTAAAAGNNGLGAVGVAYGAKIMPMRIAGPDGYAYYSTIASGLTWAADKGARVANISFDGVSGSSTIQNAAQYFKNKGGITVVAAGNNNRDEGFAPSDTMISVSATDSNDVRTSWSSYGSFVDVSAPGAGIVTTNRGGGYGSWSGTSFASPVTAGAVALILSAKSGLSPIQIESLLVTTATDLGSAGKDIYYGYGRVNASAAVQAALNTTAPDTQPPSAAISAPTGGTVSGLVPVDVNSTDNVGVARVELRVNGVTVATDTASPYQFSWDSTTMANGGATLVAVAFDAAGNSGSSSPVSVTVSNAAPAPTPTQDTTAPTVNISNPANGSTVSGTVSIHVSANDNMGASGLTQSVYVDGSLKCTGNGGSMSCNWNTRRIARGAHTIKAVAQDAAGNSASTSIQVYK